MSMFSAAIYFTGAERSWPRPALRWEVGPADAQRRATPSIVQIIIGLEGAVVNARMLRGEPAARWSAPGVNLDVHPDSARPNHLTELARWRAATIEPTFLPSCCLATADRPNGCRVPFLIL